MFKRKTDEERLDEHYQKALKQDPGAADAAMTAVRKMQEGRELTKSASEAALKEVMRLVPDLHGNRDEKIATILKYGKTFGAMEALTEFVIPQIYNDMYDKFGKTKMNPIEVDQIANLFLALTIQGIVEGLDND